MEARTVLFVLFGLGMAWMSDSAVYQVGDAAGWTIIGNVNYTAWASSKHFQVGDAIVFEYNKNFHDVMEVSKGEYDACNAVSPLAVHKTGNDTFLIKRAGHRFFICGVPGHCAAGQKVNIRVLKKQHGSSSTVAAAPSTAPIASSSSGSGNASPTDDTTTTTTVTASSPKVASAAGDLVACCRLLLACFWLCLLLW